jgi:hypothetical protein
MSDLFNFSNFADDFFLWFRDYAQKSPSTLGQKYGKVTEENEKKKK